MESKGIVQCLDNLIFRQSDILYEPLHWITCSIIRNHHDPATGASQTAWIGKELLFSMPSAPRSAAVPSSEHPASTSDLLSNNGVSGLRLNCFCR